VHGGSGASGVEEQATKAKKTSRDERRRQVLINIEGDLTCPRNATAVSGKGGREEEKEWEKEGWRKEGGR